MDPSKINYNLIPEHMREGTRAYIETGREPGDFLSAIMANDFLEAAGQADDENACNWNLWAQFIYMETPGGCHGSKEKVYAWIATGGLVGLQSKANDES